MFHNDFISAASADQRLLINLVDFRAQQSNQQWILHACKENGLELNSNIGSRWLDADPTDKKFTHTMKILGKRFLFE